MRYNNVLQKSIVQYSPLMLFVWLFRFQVSWEMNFVISGLYALGLLLLLVLEKNILDRFVLAVYCFLGFGAAMIVFNSRILEYYYTYFEQAMLPIWLVIIGVITTLTTSIGFIGVKAQRKIVLRYSLYLLIASLCACLFSFNFKGNMILSGMVPFVILRVFQAVLQHKIKNYE